MDKPKLDFEVKMVKFNEIHPDPKNIRTKRIPEQELALKRSILVNGLIQPFIVCKNPEGSGYLIVDGHRTFDACREIFTDSNPEVPVVVSSQESGTFTENELRKARLLKDIHTQKIDDWDRILAVKLYAEELRESEPDITQKAIAESLGKGEAWISEIFTAVKSGTFAPAIETGDVSYAKSRILKKAPQELQERLINETKDLSLRQTEKAIYLIECGLTVPEAILTAKSVKPDDEPPPPPEEIEKGVELSVDEGAEKEPDKDSHSVPETPKSIEDAFDFDDGTGEAGKPSDTITTPGQPKEDQPPPEEPKEEEKPEGKKEEKEPKWQKDIKGSCKTMVFLNQRPQRWLHNNVGPLRPARQNELCNFLENTSADALSVSAKIKAMQDNGSWSAHMIHHGKTYVKKLDIHSIKPNEVPDVKSALIEIGKDIDKHLNILNNSPNGRNEG